MSIQPINRVAPFTPLPTVYQERIWSELHDDLFPTTADAFPALASHVAVALHLFLRRFHQSDIAAAVAFLRTHDTLSGCPTFAFDRRDEADCQRILERHRERIVEAMDEN